MVAPGGFGTIKLTIAEGVAGSRLNRPQVLSPINNPMLTKLGAVPDIAEPDESVGAIVVSGPRDDGGRAGR